MKARSNPGFFIGHFQRLRRYSIREESLSPRKICRVYCIPLGCLHSGGRNLYDPGIDPDKSLDLVCIVNVLHQLEYTKCKTTTKQERIESLIYYSFLNGKQSCAQKSNFRSLILRHQNLQSAVLSSV